MFNDQSWNHWKPKSHQKKKRFSTGGNQWFLAKMKPPKLRPQIIFAGNLKRFTLVGRSQRWNGWKIHILSNTMSKRQQKKKENRSLESLESLDSVSGNWNGSSWESWMGNDSESIWEEELHELFLDLALRSHP